MRLINSSERLLILRFLLPGKAGRFTMLVAAIGCAGVAIGVAALILVVSFMNGAEARLGGQIASADGHIIITRRNALGTWSGLEQRLNRRPGVALSMPSLDLTGFVTVKGRSFGAEFQGLQPSRMAIVPILDRKSTTLTGRPPLHRGTVALGSELASRLGVLPGDYISVTVPQFIDGNLAIKSVDARIAGVINTDTYAFDSRRVIMPVDDLKALAHNPQSFNRINIWLNDADDPKAASTLQRWLGPQMMVRSWRDMNRSLVAALTQERIAMTAIISLVTIIALSNIASSMVMLVRHKTREIAIMRTIGMGRRSIAKVFVGVGVAIGLAGETIGLGIGFGLKTAKDPIAEALRSRLTHPPIELDVLLALPLAISTGQLAWILTLVSAGIAVSTLYPALRAAAIEPAEALRYT